MQISPHHALAASQRPSHISQPEHKPLPRILIAGATGVLGNAVLRRLVGMQRASHAKVLATLPLAQGMRQVSAHVVGTNHPETATTTDFDQWPRVQADMAVVMFDPPRMFYGRERALWTPSPEQLPALCAWIKSCGVHTLTVVMPHAQGTLPKALQRGLASLDEHALAALGFERLLIVRTAQKPSARKHQNFLEATAAWMLSTLAIMVPSNEQPVRASKVAQLVDLALHLLPQCPPGSFIAAPELVWETAQGDDAHMQRVVRAWLRPMTTNKPLN